MASHRLTALCGEMWYVASQLHLSKVTQKKRRTSGKRLAVFWFFFPPDLRPEISFKRANVGAGRFGGPSMYCSSTVPVWFSASTEMAYNHLHSSFQSQLPFSLCGHCTHTYKDRYGGGGGTRKCIVSTELS